MSNSETGPMLLIRILVFITVGHPEKSSEKISGQKLELLK